MTMPARFNSTSAPTLAAERGSTDVASPSALEGRAGQPGIPPEVEALRKQLCRRAIAGAVVHRLDERRWFVSSKSHPGYFALVTFEPGVAFTCSCDHGQAVDAADLEASPCRHLWAVTAAILDGLRAGPRIPVAWHVEQVREAIAGDGDLISAASDLVAALDAGAQP